MTEEGFDFIVSTPGRICLFGEHQDYLGLPVIAAAISRRLEMRCRFRSDAIINIAMPDISREVTLQLDASEEQLEHRDYLRSGLNVMKRAGFTLSNGIDIHVHSDIPMNAGASSSTAFVTSWIQCLAVASDHHLPLSAVELSRYAHQAEVVEFREPGGMMDHIACAYGGMNFIRFSPTLEIHSLPDRYRSFILIDTEEAKDTLEILRKVKAPVVKAWEKISRDDATLDMNNLTRRVLRSKASLLSKDESRLLDAALRNRDITTSAIELFSSHASADRQFGELLTMLHTILRDDLSISTPKIESLLSASLRAGALGGKINGSGGGGTLFVYAPEREQQVLDAIAPFGVPACVVTIDRGTTVVT